VATVGGFVQQYQIDVDPNKLRGVSLPLSAVVEAVERSNNNVGGNVVEQAGQWAIVRGMGLVESVADVENIVIGSSKGTPIYVRNVAEVKLGNAFRTGSLDKNGKEAVGGVVIMRYGVSALEAIEAVKKKIEEIKPGLPEGVEIVPFYDRTDLINRTSDTLKEALIEEFILVTLVNLIFLAHFRSIFIVTIPLPLAALVSFLFMYFWGVTSNIMSLAGIAIAVSDCSRCDQDGRPADFFFHGDNRDCVHACLRTHGSRRQAVPSTCVYKELCDDSRRRHGSDSCPSSMRLSAERKTQARGSKPNHAGITELL
jgi:Cu(I)/Ag(I) efflux system membrane protein CusA/SilA